MLKDTIGQAIWSKLILTTIAILTQPSFSATEETDFDEEEIEIGYTPNFRSFIVARNAVKDPFPDKADPTLGFAQSLDQVSNAYSRCILPLIQQGLNGADPK
jgi:hypothetical protein